VARGHFLGHKLGKLPKLDQRRGRIVEEVSLGQRTKAS
jgi:hypothetical protein